MFLMGLLVLRLRGERCACARVRERERERVCVSGCAGLSHMELILAPKLWIICMLERKACVHSDNLPQSAVDSSGTERTSTRRSRYRRLFMRCETSAIR